MKWQGDGKLLEGYKIAFLYSRRCPASVVLKAYDWARAIRMEGRCVLSGNHSQIECASLSAKRKPANHSGPRARIEEAVEPEFAQALSNNRLLIITRFDASVTRVTQETANKRNDLMADIADEIFVVYAHLNGNVYNLIMKWLKKGKKVSTFDVEENRALMKAGAQIL